MKKRKFILKVVVIVAMALGLSGVVYAIPCSVGSVSGDTGPDYLCRDGYTSNDWNADLNVDNGGLPFFGYTDWLQLEKNDGVADVKDFAVDLEIDSLDQISGTWKFNNSPWAVGYSDIMLVLKGGNTGYSLYNVLSGHISGEWDSGGSIGRPDLSHMSVYGREGTPIPEPSTMLLLGIGIAGFVGFRRKLKS